MSGYLLVGLTALSFFIPNGVVASTEQRRVLIWLYDCSTATLVALKNHTDAFNAIAPSVYHLGQDAVGSAVLSGDASGCINDIKSILPGVEIWPWITSPNWLKPANESALMRRLFADPRKFSERAKSEANAFGLSGFNVDFEAPGQATNRNKTLWRETLAWADGFARDVQDGAGVPVVLDVMCTANATPPGEFCGNKAPTFNASATSDMVAEMRASRVQRFGSMGTYTKDSATLLNQIDWFANELPGKWGMGVCPSCGPIGSEGPEQLLLRFGTAHAYGVREVDLFAFSATVAPKWDAYWPYMRAFLKCDVKGRSETPSGQCWPYDNSSTEAQVVHV